MNQVDQFFLADLGIDTLGEVGIVGGDPPRTLAGVAALAEGAAQRQQGGCAKVDGIGAQRNRLDGVAGASVRLRPPQWRPDF